MNCASPRAPTGDTEFRLNDDSPLTIFASNAAPDNRFPVTGFTYLDAM